MLIARIEAFTRSLMRSNSLPPILESEGFFSPPRYRDKLSICSTETYNTSPPAYSTAI